MDCIVLLYPLTFHHRFDTQGCTRCKKLYLLILSFVSIDLIFVLIELYLYIYVYVSKFLDTHMYELAKDHS